MFILVLVYVYISCSVNIKFDITFKRALKQWFQLKKDSDSYNKILTKSLLVIILMAVLLILQLKWPN